MDNYGFPVSAGPVPNPRVPLSAQAAILQNEYAKVLAQPDSPQRAQNLQALTTEMQRYRVAPVPASLDAFTAALPTQAPAANATAAPGDLASFTSALPMQGDAGAAATDASSRSSSVGPALGTLARRLVTMGPAGVLADVGVGAIKGLGSLAEIGGAAIGERAPVQAAERWFANKAAQKFGTLPGSAFAQSVGQSLPALAVPGLGEGVLATALRGGMQGLLANAATPSYDVPDASYWQTKAAQANEGAEMGGAMAGGFGLLGKLAGPTAPAASLIKQGITPTIGQTIGGAAKALEEKLSSVPILGDAIKSAQASGLDDFNRAIYNRVLAPLGQNYSGPVGQPALASLRNSLGNAYETTLARMSPSPLTNEFTSGIDSLRSMLASRPAALQTFDNAINGDLWPRFTEANTLTPSALKDADSALGSTVRDYIGSNDADQRAAARALAQAQSGLRQMAAQANPEQAPVLNAINNGYGQLVQLQNAAKTVKVARNEGVVTPADYLRGIKSGDNSVRDNVFSSGGARNQDFAQTADRVLSSVYPDSGTAGRGLMAAALTAGLAHELPTNLLLGAGAATLPYLPLLRRAAVMLPRTIGATAALAPYAALGSPAAAGLLAPRP